MILVTGATGHYGSKTVEHLLNKGIDPSGISVLVRDSDKAVGIKEKGVQIKVGDYTDHTSMVKAFQGVDKLLLVSSNNREAIENRTMHHENVIKAAKEGKVSHIIYTSFVRKPGYENSAIADFQNSHVKSEKYLKESGIDYTILQNGIYAEMILAFVGDKVRETNKIQFPAGEGKASWVIRDELAEAAAHVLTSEGHRNKTYSLTNNESVDFKFIAQKISEVFKKEIGYKSPTINEFRSNMEKASVPDMFIGMLSIWGTALAEQTMDNEDDTLSTFLNRKPTSVSQFLRKVYS